MPRKRLAEHSVTYSYSELTIRNAPLWSVVLGWIFLLLNLLGLTMQLLTTREAMSIVIHILMIAACSTLVFFPRTTLVVSRSNKDITLNGKKRAERDKVMLMEESDSISAKLNIYAPDEQIYSFGSNSKKQIAELKALIESYLPPIEERIQNMGEWHEAH